MRALTFALALAGLAASPANAQEGPWLLRGDVGWADIHDSPDRGPSGSLRLGRALGASRVFSLDLGVNAGLADEGFVSGVLGLEARAFARGSVSPFVRLEGGLIFEESMSYSLLGVGGGVAVRLNPSLSLRASAMFADHAFPESGIGPKVYQVGIEYRF